MTSIVKNNNNVQSSSSEDDDSDDELDIFSKLNALATKAGENAKLDSSKGDDDEEEKYEAYYQLLLNELRQLETNIVLPHLCKEISFNNSNLKETLPQKYYKEIEDIKMLIQYFIDGKYLDIIIFDSTYSNLFKRNNERSIFMKERATANTTNGDEDQEEEEEQQDTNNLSIDVRDIYRASISLRTRCIEFISGIDSTNNMEDNNQDESEEEISEKEIEFYRAIRTFKLLLIGAASLNLFVQANWTGPPVHLIDHNYNSNNNNNADDKNEKKTKMLWLLPMVNNNKIANSKSFSYVDDARAATRMALETEGFSSYPHCEVPECLIASRTIFNLLNAPLKNKKNSLKWCDRNPITLGISETIEDGEKLTMVQNASKVFKTVSWWAGRTTVAHHRTLSTGIEGCEIFKRNAKDEFETTIRLHPFLDEERNLVKGAQAIICAQLHLEWGLAQHYWNETNGAKKSIRQAQAITGLSASVSGAVGVRGKWSKETAQMVLLAESKSTTDDNDDGTAVIKKNDASNTDDDDDDDNNNNNTTNDVNNNSKIEYSVNNNEKKDEPTRKSHAKVKEILLEEIDPDTPLLERIKFSNESPYKSDLSLIDQAIVLGLCVDVSNQNPKDGLTNEQMSAYIARVMTVESTRNWMVYTTSLITKSFVEYERWKTKERSVLQLQALVDQHTNRITAGQMPTTDINAPADERMAIIYALVMPPLFEMKRQLADRYMGIYVKRSALELYRELELWEDVVQCLLDTKQDHEALSLVAAQLDKKPSPMLWCCLGELEDNDDHFRTAWEISNKRYARAMRLLGKRLFHRALYDESIECYLASLAIRPQEHHAWWRVGTASMRIEKWNMALRAWTHCARIEPTDGEAWGNMGAVYCRLNQLDEAYNAFDQGLKQQRQNWKMWENFMLLSLRTRRYGRALYGQEQLLNLRHKRDEKGAKSSGETSPSDAVDLETINILTNVITTSLDCKRDPSIMETLDEISKEKIVDNFNSPASFHAPRLLRLFGTIERTVKASPPLWALYGQLCCAMGDMKKARECCSSELRMLKTVEDWEKDEEFCMNITRTTLRLVELANMKVDNECVDKDAQENAKMVVQSSINGVGKFYKDSEMMKRLEKAFA